MKQRPKGFLRGQRLGLRAATGTSYGGRASRVWPITDHIGGEDRRQATLLTGQCNFPNLLGRIVEGPVRL